MHDPAKLVANFGRIVERSQRLLQAYLAHQARGNHFTIPDPGIVAKSFMELGKRLMADPSALLHAQMRLAQDYLQLWHTTTRRLLGQEVEPMIQPPPGDKRFKDEEWAENVMFDFIKQSYLLAARTIQSTVAEVKGLDPKTAERVDFYTRQYIDAMAPTNFALTNPKVLKATLESGGDNLVKGLEHLLADLDRGQGKLRISMTDLEAFRLGENVAITPGKVIYQTELMQLLQYNPATEKVFKRPLLIVPPWINKFYILDLRPKNSFIHWAIEQGFTVFVISWVNPDERLAEKDFEDYLAEGTLAALDAIAQATGVDEVNAVSYCIGGTLLACTLAYLATKGDTRVKSATFFTTMLDFTDPGELSVFIDEEQLQLIEQRMEEKGYLEGTDMANVFNLLRSNDLIWSFVVNNYLMGREPMAFDLLFWNSDATRMPRRMHSFYLRNMYQRNRLKEPGGITLLNEPIDLRRIQIPAYFLSTREDHIAPWKSTYAGAKLLSGPVKFVLGGSGHIAGVINPASSKKYGYTTSGKLPETPEEWVAGAKEHEGSWWPDWLRWVKRYAGAQVPARVPGDGALPALEDAPGSYVKVRI
ncbi:MAG TPA: class I poly(R)-hydroxyalkanoic acid synthase [Candidatus Competibacteraceae bacterium]|nr:class I poly(R)-hydroxyalkanoic acid synthase [Candidatus Competibacteraceae bacterium]